MAKYETRFTGSFDQTLDFIERRIQDSADSMNLVDLSDFSLGETRIAVRVYDKYFMRNGNRASLTVTLAGQGTDLCLCVLGPAAAAVLSSISVWVQKALW